MVNVDLRGKNTIFRETVGKTNSVVHYINAHII